MNLKQVIKIDDLSIGDHSYLRDDDECYYFREYTAHKGFNHNDTNSLIFNFKKSVAHRGEHQYKYKQGAIIRVARMFIESLKPIKDNMDYTLVPMPPSKTKENALYDDRMVEVLNLFSPENTRELLYTNKDRAPAHNTDNKRDKDKIRDSISIDEDLADEIAPNIVLFDDVITTGAQYTVCKEMLQERFPECAISGIFIARRAIERDSVEDDFADFFGL